MKRFLSYSAIMLFAMLAWRCSSDHRSDLEVAITFDELPSKARDFITNFYPGANVSFVESETTSSAVSYDVTLSGGQNIEFDASGEWTDVESPDRQVIPHGIAPAEIEDYVRGYYPDEGINAIEKIIPSGYEVELTNGINLIFTQDCTFMTSYD